MPRQKSEDLKTYQTWLKLYLGLSEATATVYASHLRSTLPYITDITSQDSVSEGFEKMSHDCPRKVLSARKTAWKRLVEFGASKGVEIALPKEKLKLKKSGPPGMPHEVRAVLAYLVTGRRFKHST